MRFRVDEMGCSNCVRHITEAVEALDPQAKVEADLETKLVTIATSASADKVAAALLAEGYPAVAA